MRTTLVFPAICRDKQRFATAESQTVFDPHRAVAQRPAYVGKRGDLQCTNRTFMIFSPEKRTTHRTKIDDRFERQRAVVLRVEILQPPHCRHDGLTIGGLPRQRDQGRQ